MLQDEENHRKDDHSCHSSDRSCHSPSNDTPTVQQLRVARSWVLSFIPENPGAVSQGPALAALFVDVRCRSATSQPQRCHSFDARGTAVAKRHTAGRGAPIVGRSGPGPRRTDARSCSTSFSAASSTKTVETPSASCHSPRLRGHDLRCSRKSSSSKIGDESSNVKTFLNYWLFQHFWPQKVAKPSNRSNWTFWPNSSITGVEQGEPFNS